jgi:tight adherence protein B
VRRLPCLIAVSAATLALAAGSAAGGVVIHAVDTSAYPTIRVTVVTANPLTRPPMLREDGHNVTGVQATNLASAKSVVLALDHSRSMAGRPLADATAAARVFLAAKGSSDRVSVVTFGSRAGQLTGFSPSSSDGDAALRGLRTDAKEGTKLWDAVALGSQLLGAEPQRGRALVLLTDGRDTGSEASAEKAAEMARKAGVTVYVIGIEGTQFSPGPLRGLARATGGSYVGAHTTAELRGAYGAVATALRRTWQLEYATTARPGERVGLRARGDGGADTTQLTMTGPSGPGGAGASPLLPKPFLETAFGTLLLSLGVGFVVLLAGTFVLASVEGGRLRRRLAPHIGEARQRRRSEEEGRTAVFAGIFRATEEVFSGQRPWIALQRLLERADVPLRTVEFAYVIVGGALVGFVLFLLLLGSMFMAFLGLLVGGAAPIGWLILKAKRRIRAFEEQLPDFLVALAATLKAGHSFRQALKTVADEGRPPASKELNRVLTEARLGRPMEAALSEMSQRVGSPNFEFVITSVTIQRQVGGSLAGLIDMVADTVRQRQQFARKISGLTAMGRASAYVLMGLPFFMALMITLINPGYMEPLYHTSTGHQLIILGLVMMAFGCLVMRRIVAFKG